MARINLLPWREVKKKEREKRFYVMAAVTVIAALAVVATVHMEYEKQITYQNTRNQFLTQQIKAVEKEIIAIKTLEEEKTNLLNRMEVIQRLQKSRPEIVYLFEAIVTTTPDGVQLLKISHDENVLNVEGIAESNSRISSFMRNIDKSQWLQDPELIVIDADTKEYPDHSWFSMKVKRSHP